MADYREMVKTLVCGVKTITWGAGSCKISNNGTLLNIEGNAPFARMLILYLFNVDFIRDIFLGRITLR